MCTDAENTRKIKTRNQSLCENQQSASRVLPTLSIYAFKVYFMCLGLCVYTCVEEPTEGKRASDPLELEFQAAVRHQVVARYENSPLQSSQSLTHRAMAPPRLIQRLGLTLN